MKISTKVELNFSIVLIFCFINSVYNWTRLCVLITLPHTNLIVSNSFIYNFPLDNSYKKMDQRITFKLNWLVLYSSALEWTENIEEWEKIEEISRACSIVLQIINQIRPGQTSYSSFLKLSPRTSTSYQIAWVGETWRKMT